MRRALWGTRPSSPYRRRSPLRIRHSPFSSGRKEEPGFHSPPFRRPSRRGMTHPRPPWSGKTGEWSAAGSLSLVEGRECVTKDRERDTREGERGTKDGECGGPFFVG